MTKLSIIIINYNTKDLTLDCLKSIRESNTDFPYEIIVVDNGSTDGSVEAIEDLKLKNQNESLKFQIIVNNENRGFAKAVNQGIRKAVGEHILLLNSDTQVEKGSLNKLLDFAEKVPNLGIVGPKLLNPDATTQGSVFRFPTVWRTIQQYWLGKQGLLDKYSPKGEGPVEVEALSMACALLTPECLKKAGLLNEKYFFYFEDLDYCRRVKKMGLKIYYLPTADVIHYHGVSGKNLAKPELQWRRLIPSSKIYHGALNHFLIYLVTKTGQICSKLLRKSKGSI